MVSNQYYFEENFPQIKGLDILNLAIDKCSSAKAFRYSAMTLLTSEDLYVLIGSIEDDTIDLSIRKHIRHYLNHHFTSGQLGLFATHMLDQARIAPSEYYTDYYYSLYQAAVSLMDREEYLDFSKRYQAFMNDNSEQAILIRSKIGDVERQAQEIGKNQNFKMGE